MRRTAPSGLGSRGLGSRGLALALTIALVAGVVSSAGAKPYERVARADYSAGTTHLEAGTSCNGFNLRSSAGAETVYFQVKKGERSVDLSIVDTVPGQQVAAFVIQAGVESGGTTFCGSFENYPLSGRGQLEVGVIYKVSDAGLSVPTNGYVEAIFHKA